MNIRLGCNYLVQTLKENYAPSTDKAGEGSNNCIPRSNPCIRTFCKSLINSLLAKAGEERSTSENPSVRFVDACSVALVKDKYQTEIKEFVKAAGISLEEFYLLSMMSIGFHSKYYKIINNGKPMPLIVASANARDNLLDMELEFADNGTILTCLLKYFGVVPHGECFVVKRNLMQWDDADYVRFNLSLVMFYSSFPELEVIGKLIEMGSRITHRYSGWDFMTVQEREDMKALRRAIQETATSQI